MSEEPPSADKPVRGGRTPRGHPPSGASRRGARSLMTPSPSDAGTPSRCTPATVSSDPRSSRPTTHPSLEHDGPVGDPYQLVEVGGDQQTPRPRRPRSRTTSRCRRARRRLRPGWARRAAARRARWRTTGQQSPSAGCHPTAWTAARGRPARTERSSPTLCRLAHEHRELGTGSTPIVAAPSCSRRSGRGTPPGRPGPRARTEPGRHRVGRVAEVHRSPATDLAARGPRSRRTASSAARSTGPEQPGDAEHLAPLRSKVTSTQRPAAQPATCKSCSVPAACSWAAGNIDRRAPDDQLDELASSSPSADGSRHGDRRGAR